MYVDAKKHAAAIGAPVTIRPIAGAMFTAFGKKGVRGKNLLVAPHHMVVQAWRAQSWKTSDPDSVLVLTFAETRRGARINLVQAAVPDHAFKMIDDGWRNMYWKPWRAYLASKRTRWSRGARPRSTR